MKSFFKFLWKMLWWPIGFACKIIFHAIMNVLGFALLTVALAAVIVVPAVYFWTAPGPLAETKTIMIERGGIRQISDTLFKEGVIGEPHQLFMVGVIATGLRGDLKAGEYEFPARASMHDVASLMASGHVVVHKVTVVEGMTVAEVLALLKADPVLDGDITTTPPEGLLLPETYFYNRGDKRAEVLARMQEAGEKALAEAWAHRDPALPLTSSQQLLTLASIVEKETGVASERARVAGVYINRLKQGMRLQSDPTTIYALNRTGNLGRALTLNDLKTESPYNTYMSDGLPPGPIANPGLASLQAAARPENHDFIYFVADGSGGHAFAKTLDEHNRNVAQWRQLQRQNAAK